MATTLPVTDKGDSLTDITKNMTKYIRHLEANVQSIKKIPTPEDILNEVKNNVWYRMCKPCQSKVFDISSKDLYSRNNYPSKRLCKEAKVTDIGNSKTRHKSKKSDLDESFDAPIEIEQMLAKRESMPHPLQLQDQEKKEDLQTKISILKNSIEEKNEKIRSLENQLKMHLKSHTENTEEEKQGDFDTVQKEKEEYVEQLSQLQTERQALEDQTNSLTSTNEECSPTVEGLQRNIDRLTVELEEKQGHFDKGQKEKEKYVREVSQLQTERQTLEDRTSSLNRNNEELSSELKIQQQNIKKMTGELEEKQMELDKVQKENERYITDISQLQTEKQTFQDQTSSLNRTNDEMTSAMEGLQRDIDRLTGELEKNQCDLDTIQEEKEEFVKQVSQLQTERQTLEDKTSSLTSTNEELSSNVEDLQRDIDRLTVEHEEKQGHFDKGQKGKEEYVREVSHLHTESQTPQDQTSSLNRTNEKNFKEVSQLQTEKQTLQNQTSSLNRTNKEITSAMDGLQWDIDRLSGGLARMTLQDQTRPLNKAIVNEELSSTLKIQQQNIEKMTGELVKKDEEINNLKTVLEEC
ncbi:paramyosin-like isoform X1 [Mizuhopecten yessoensis]|uniref:paramyosin-like isoform X1 n=1 Tax=Mizuhopecten yessoensis TaxID=6573 RepID=UPI000B45BA0E|nr:paramyosin-like isoform X1 [Mizuhopecten yessoensis]XP_021378727.1 paramyosin-like isoform X1 [Mizuhopecten yessoensis]